MRISNFSIMARISACFLALGVTVGASLWFATGQMRAIDDRYTVLLDKESFGATSLTRAQARVYDFGRLVWRTVSSPERERLVQMSAEVSATSAVFFDQMAAAAKGLPHYKTRLEELAGRQREAFSRFAAIEKFMVEGNQAAALEAADSVGKLNAEIRNGMLALLSEVQKSVQQRSDDLTIQTNDAIFYTTLAIAIGFLATLAGAFAMIKMTIAAPLDSLSSSMNILAQGQLEADVPGAERGDEVGTMAKAVLVFKENGVKARVAEEQARLAREEVERERATAEERRAAAAREQAMVVENLGRGLSRLAGRDLTVALSGFPADYKKLEDDFNAAIVPLRETMVVVNGNASTILSSSSEISSAADDLSKRTEQQAASLEETAAALDQITATGRKAAEGAEHAREVVSLAKTDAEKTGQVVDRTVEAIGNIEKSAQQISQIIGVIDEIAFQTNLLALNAGVEAARAGEAGRGFAVVASEVRALAQRSAEAAKEIKGLISTSTAQVAEGVELVAETGKALRRILTQVTDINAVVVDIAAGAHEQATGLAQVNTAINQMDQATQQNASMVEESTAASHALTQEANALSALIGQFNVGGAAKAAPRATASAPRPQQRHAAPKSGGNAVAKVAPQAAADDWQDF